MRGGFFWVNIFISIYTFNHYVDLLIVLDCIYKKMLVFTKENWYHNLNHLASTVFWKTVWISGGSVAVKNKSKHTEHMAPFLDLRDRVKGMTGRE